ncbi:MAG: hypothetical protein JXB34_13925 [Bacteroidales bacterium]|nr:hypothetical protein [Bacteroidales bacterium]
MKLAKSILISALFIFAAGACKTEEKAATERRNLMMPQKQELRRNDKYVPPKDRKTYSTAKKRKKPKNR